MSVPLSTVPENQEGSAETSESVSPAQAKHEAAEIIARARRQAEAIVAEARDSSDATAPPSPLAALGDNAEEIIGQVRKLIKKQRKLQDERQEMQTEIDELKAERDELIQRLTDAVERMEELATLAQQSPAETRYAPPPPPPPTPSQPPPPPPPPMQRDPEPAQEDTSLAARLEQAEKERRGEDGDADSSDRPRPAPLPFADDEPANGATPYVVGSDGRSFYSRHSAKLPRLEGDGGRSVLSAVGDMRPDSEPRGRKGRRRKKG